MRMLRLGRLRHVRYMRVEYIAVLGDDFGNAVGRGSPSLVSEHRIGRCQLQQRHFRATENDREIARQGPFETEPSCGIADTVHADLVADLHRDRVDRMSERGGKADGAPVARRCVAWCPAAHRNGFIRNRTVGRVAGFQCRQIDDGLERRSRLPHCLRCAVELAFEIGTPADHRAHGAVGTEGYQCGLRDVARVAGIG